MYFNSNDLLETIKIAIVLVASGFALYFPLLAIVKKPDLALKLSIPVSFSFQIIIGYIFYTFFNFSVYPLCYLCLILLLNLYAIYKIRPKFHLKKPSLGTSLIFLLIITALIYTFFFDAIHNIAPGTIDAYKHLNYISYDLKQFGYLSCAYYAPGFHILIFPLTDFVSQLSIYRFAGPIVGLITILNIYLLFRDKIKNKILLVLMIALFVAPFLSQLALQLIGFFPTALTFIFAPFFLYLLMVSDELENSLKTWLLAVSLISLAITVPYLVVQFIPIFFVLLILSIFYKKTLSRGLIKKNFIFLLISLFAFFIAFGHVYLQTKIQKSDLVFPALAIVSQNEDSLVFSYNSKYIDSFISALPEFWQKIAQKPLAKDYVLPMAVTGSDILSVKNIRPLNSYLSIGAYAIILLAFMVITYSIKKGKWDLLVLSVAVSVFGISVQTGILEMSTYRGRSGYYMLLFSIIFIIFIIKEFCIDNMVATKKFLIDRCEKIAIFAIIIILVASFIFPPKYYRSYYPEYFTIANDLSNQNKDKIILIITDHPEIYVVSKDLITAPLDIVSDFNKCEYYKCYIAFSKIYFAPDPVLSQQALSVDKDFKAFNEDQELAKKNQLMTIDMAKSSPDFIKNYKEYWQNDNIIVYIYEN